MSKEGVRSAYWDNIKGFLILLVVFGHVLFQLQGSSAINGIVFDDICNTVLIRGQGVSRIDTLKKGLPDAEFVFIVPWTSTDGDRYCDLSYSDKTSLNERYFRALAEYCTGNDILYVDANPYIKDRLSVSPDRAYLLDHIHPNSSKGVIMYSEAVFSYY